MWEKTFISENVLCLQLAIITRKSPPNIYRKIRIIWHSRHEYEYELWNYCEMKKKAHDATEHTVFCNKLFD